MKQLDAKELLEKARLANTQADDPSALSSAADSEYVPTSIYIYRKPDKTEYFIGETFDPTGMIVYAILNYRYPVDITEYVSADPTVMSKGTTQVRIYAIYDMTQEFSAYLDVKVKGRLASISIARLPDENRYVEGDRFDPTGMEVSAGYEDGTERKVTGFIAEGKALSSSDRSVKVSYTEGGITKTATQYVRVMTKEQGYYGNTYHGNSCIGENPVICLATMGTVYALCGISAGNGFHETGTSLLHVQQMPSRLRKLCRGMPSGWKLDCQRFLLKDGHDSEGNGTYKYIDGEGFVHTFVLFDSEYGRYYDSSGSGLVMEPDDGMSGHVIRDTQGNGLFFLEGRLAKSVSETKGSTESYEYDEEGRPVRIHDQSDESTYVLLEYGNGVLSKMSSVFGGDLTRTLSIGYDEEGRPVLLSETVGDSSRDLLCMEYDQEGCLSLTYDPKTLSAIGMGYDRDILVNRGGHRLSRCGTGYMKDGSFVMKEYLALGLVNVMSTDFSTVNEVCLRDHNGFGTSYLLDADGEVISRFEGNRNRGYLTLAREEGIPLDYSMFYTSMNLTLVTAGTINGTANGMTSAGCMLLDGLSMGEDVLDGSKCLALSFHLYHAHPGKRLCIRVTVNGSVREWTDVDATAYEAWQKVTVPFVRPEGTISSVMIEAYCGKDSVDVLVSNIRLVKSSYAALYVNNGGTRFRDYGEIRIYHLSSSSPTCSFDNSNDPELFMTENDLAMTLRMMRQRQTRGGIDVSLCDGRRMAKARYGVSAGSGERFSLLSSLDNASSEEERKWHIRTLSADGKTETRNHVTFGDEWTSAETTMTKGELTTSISEKYDRHGRLLHSRDEYGAETTRTYSAQGSLTEEILSAGEEELRTFKASYSSEGFPLRQGNGISSQGYAYDRKHGCVAASTGCDHDFLFDTDTLSSRRKLFGYDPFHERVTKVTAEDGKTALGTNLADESGNTSAVTDGMAFYRETYDPESGTTETYAKENGGEVLLFRSEDNGLTRKDTYFSDTEYTETTEYDRYGKILSRGTALYEYEQDDGSKAGHRLKGIQDSSLKLATSFLYDDDGGLKGIRESSLGKERFSATKASDTRMDFRFGGDDTFSSVLEYGSDAIASPRIRSTRHLAENAEIPAEGWLYEYDALGRLAEKTNKTGTLWDSRYRYSYLASGSMTTGLVSGCTYNGSVLFDDSFLTIDSRYGYDGRGNILSETTSMSCKSPQADYRLCSETARNYSYDPANRISSMEETVTDAKTGRKTSDTYSYSYDGSGRMTDISYRGFPGTLSYDARGRLASIRFSGGGAEFCSFRYGYDSFGNRTEKRYYGGDTVEKYEWTRGRLLSKVTDYEDALTASYSYDSSGIRKSRMANGVETQFYYLGTRLMGEDRSDGKRLRYCYDNEGLCGFRYHDGTSWKSYTYVKNVMGDIVMVKDEMGVPKVKYAYDPFGNVTATCLNLSGRTDSKEEEEIARINPFRYRGYYYDEETRLYYLITRYYDPWIGKFISPDPFSYLDISSIGGVDLYCYCLNNPVMNIDPEGQDWWNWLISGLQVAGGIALCLVPGTQGIGYGLILSGAFGLVSNAVSSVIGSEIGGFGSVANGFGAISTGISLLGLGTPGIIGGVSLILIGSATMAFGLNEAVDVVSGTNYIQKWTGMSDVAYGWTYFGLNLASIIGQIVGTRYRQIRTRMPTIDKKDGSVKQYRYFRKNHHRFYDKDFNHSAYGKESIKFPHYHGWVTHKDRIKAHQSIIDFMIWILTGGGE